MPYYRLTVLATLCLLLSNCSSSQRSKPHASDATVPTPQKGVPARLLVRSDSVDDLVFPPPGTAHRHLRPALAAQNPLNQRPAFAVESPSSTRFSVAHQRVRVAFNREVRGARQGVPARAVLQLKPSVPGLLHWTDARTLEFKAAQPFDPSLTYQVSVAGVTSVDGDALNTTWQGSFTAAGPQLAGKELGYLPKPGDARVVAVSVGDEQLVARRPKFLVLYDQPLPVELVRRRIELKRAREFVPLRVTHAKRGDYNGHAVPQRQLFGVQALTELAHEETLELSVLDEVLGAERQGLRVKLRVAPRLQPEQVRCDYAAASCEKSSESLLLEAGWFRVGFNNPLAHSSRELQRLIQVTPRPANLGADAHNYYSGSELSLRGDFKPGTTYRVKIPRLRDQYGSTLAKPMVFNVRRRPLPASLSMAEGALWLNNEELTNFEFSSRNVERAQLWLWPVPLDNQKAYAEALRGNSIEKKPPFAVLPIDVRARLDEFVTTSVDLSRVLHQATAFMVQLRHDVAAFHAKPPNYPADAAAHAPPSVVLSHGGPAALSVHAHTTSTTSLVLVTDRATGNAVAGAEVRLGAGKPARTNAKGVAVLDTAGHDGQDLLEVRSANRRVLLPLHQGRTRSNQLFPELSGRTGAASPDIVWQTDRGIYRPGETLYAKANIFERSATGLAPASDQEFEWSLVGADGQQLKRAKVRSNAYGSISFHYNLPKQARLGNAGIALWRGQQELGRHSVRIAAFEAPKFVVDIDVPETLTRPEASLGFRGRYLFGAPLTAAAIEWSVTARPAQVPPGPLARAGLNFEANENVLDDREPIRWSTTGRGSLNAAGELSVKSQLPLGEALSPVELRVQAEVSDESYETAASEQTVLFHPAARYAGLRLGRNWVGSGEDVVVELGASDTEGRAALGARVETQLHRVRYRLLHERTPSGALRRHYKRQQQLVARCSITSAADPKSCSLKAKTSGRHLVSAWVDGRPGGTQSLWVSGPSEGAADEAESQEPRVSIVADKTHYEPGDTARLLFDNPLPNATALITLEGQKLYAHRVFDVAKGLHTVDLPLSSEHAPFVHATISLIPRGSTGPQAAPVLGALRLPVTLSDAKLSVRVSSDSAEYKPKQRAKLKVAVTHAGQPVTDAELLLFVVDEGVLRLTSFRPNDPITTLWKGSALDFYFSDTRWDLARWHAHSHVAGDGGGEGDLSGFLTRRTFVHTALWKPHLRLARDGRATVDFTLPDNLTQFRMLAVAIDKKGRAGVHEGSFEVKQKVLLSPAVPRFAKVGDSFEAAAMLHNTSAQPFRGTLTIDGKRLNAVVPAQARVRLGRQLSYRTPGQKSLSFALSDAAGKKVDSVEQSLNVALPGTAHKPRLVGTFSDSQSIRLEIPEGISAEDDQLRLVLGENLEPELGAQLEFLMGYPHGCVEQTTSSTLPLIAARTVLPFLGMRSKSQDYYDTRISHGLRRLDSMRTSSGGLAYWPGGRQPNVFGTAYAMRAVMGAQGLGIELPDGLSENMLSYLGQALFNAQVVPEVRSAIALSLAESKKLKASDADALFDLRRELGVFGKANLALALNSLPHQAPRVRKLLDDIESRLHDGGRLGPENREDMHAFSSDTRALAQASLALSRLRPGSRVLAPSVRQLLNLDEGYTTQATAYRLLALSEHVVRASEQPAAPRVKLGSVALKPTRILNGGTHEYTIPLSQLAGTRKLLTLLATGKRQVSFSLSATYKLYSERAKGDLTFDATSGDNGPHLYRVFTTPEGAPLDLQRVNAGELVRVALLAERNGVNATGALSYLAISDALPAGFEAVDASLDTVRAGPALDERHPWHAELSRSPKPDHVELGDDEVNIYFDHPRRNKVAASYLVRATNPGRFQLPAARAELMYETHSTSYTESTSVEIR